MSYWVARAKPADNEPFEDWLIRNRMGRWWTKQPPRSWQKGDRTFVWASKPRLEIVGLAELYSLPTARDKDGFYWYRLRYLTDVMRDPVPLFEIRANPLLQASILLKQGPSTSVVRLTEEEGRVLYSLVVRRNPQEKSIWPRLSRDGRLDNPVPPDLDLGGEEGSRVLRKHLSIERDKKLIKAKKRAVLAATGRLACEVCGFDFHETYGDRGKDFCEVHHLQPLTGGARTTNLRHLAVVCSNCHRVVHRNATALKLTDLRKTMKATHNHVLQRTAASGRR